MCKSGEGNHLGPEEKVEQNSAVISTTFGSFYKRHCEVVGGCTNCRLSWCPMADG